MQLLSLLALIGLVCDATAKSSRQAWADLKNFEAPRPRHGYPMQPGQYQKRLEKRTIIPQNGNTTKFAVDGTKIPEVNFDIGESYAGLLPISSAANASQLYFWFFPSSNALAGDEILIWLNGGPGCSSLEGFLQENGPISWQYGTYKPIYNPWTWVNLTNIVWVEQPVGTGFTQGTPTAHSEEEAAQQFLGWFKNFVDTFGLHNRKVYIAGESYAGKYVPYIADAMLNTNNTKYYGLDSILIYDPSINTDSVLEEVPAVAFVDHWAHLFNFNSTFTTDIHARAAKCGYQDYLAKYLTYPPPPGPFPQPTSSQECDLWGAIADAVFYTNPCFDIYQIATTCPLLWDVLGFPGSFDYLPAGASIYFNRTDVQKAINAPIQPWSECADGVLRPDTSAESSFGVLPRVIDRAQRTMIVHGELDFILLGNGSLLTIQNMTWGGAQGFQKQPTEEFFVPYHDEVSLGSLSASGIMGIAHTERKLTWVEQRMSGHMVPQYQPSSAYRQVEFLLGRIESLSQRGSFTTRPGGNSTVNSTAVHASFDKTLPRKIRDM